MEGWLLFVIPVSMIGDLSGCLSIKMSLGPSEPL